MNNIYFINVYKPGKCIYYVRYDGAKKAKEKC